MDNMQYSYNIRSGKHINIIEYAKELEDNYKIQLKESVDAFKTYDEVSSETFNDYLVVRAQFYILKEMGYIEPKEYSAVDTILMKIRIEMLDKIKNVPESAND